MKEKRNTDKTRNMHGSSLRKGSTLQIASRATIDLTIDANHEIHVRENSHDVIGDR